VSVGNFFYISSFLFWELVLADFLGLEINISTLVSFLDLAIFGESEGFTGDKLSFGILPNCWSPEYLL
jgi:hypothetical protein